MKNHRSRQEPRSPFSRLLNENEATADESKLVPDESMIEEEISNANETPVQCNGETFGAGQQPKKTVEPQPVPVFKAPVAAEEEIEEQIDAGMNETNTSEFYNIAAVQGGVPLKTTRRPFTPPFAQLAQSVQIQKVDRVPEGNRYVYDRLLKAYFDPETKEYFEVK